MNSTVVAKPLAQVETPLLAVAVAQGGEVPASLTDLDGAAGGAIGRAVASGDFKGKRDETSLLYTAGGKAQRILLVGMGKAGEVTRTSIRRAAAVAAKRARALGTGSLTCAVAVEARNGVGARDLGQVVVEGAAQGAWGFTELKASPEETKPEVESVAVVVDAKERAEAETGRRIGDAIAAGHRLARYLQMQPGNVCTPSYLAEQAQKLAGAHGFAVAVLDRAALQAERMGALLAVAQGSQEDRKSVV